MELGRGLVGCGLLKSSNIRMSFSGRGRGGVVSVGDGAAGRREALIRRPKRRLEVSTSGILSFLFSSYRSGGSPSSNSGDGVLGIRSPICLRRQLPSKFSSSIAKDS